MGQFAEYQPVTWSLISDLVREGMRDGILTSERFPALCKMAEPQESEMSEEDVLDSLIVYSELRSAMGYKEYDELLPWQQVLATFLKACEGNQHDLEVVRDSFLQKIEAEFGGGGLSIEAKEAMEREANSIFAGYFGGYD
jgi:hypothetical protein